MPCHPGPASHVLVWIPAYAKQANAESWALVTFREFMDAPSPALPESPRATVPLPRNTSEQVLTSFVMVALGDLGVALDPAKQFVRHRRFPYPHSDYEPFYWVHSTKAVP